jgi:hypothetical protein
MVITCFNRRSTILFLKAETVFLKPLLIISDKVNIVTPLSAYFLSFKYVPLLHGDLILKLYKSVCEKDEKMGMERIFSNEQYEQMLWVTKHLNKTKHKNRAQLILQSQLNKAIACFRDYILADIDVQLEEANALVLKKFVDQKILVPYESTEHENKELSEDNYIEMITGCILKEPDLLWFFEIAANKLPYILFTDKSYKIESVSLTTHPVYFCIPLFAMFPLEDLDYDEISFTRKNLLSAFQPISEKIEAFRLWVEEQDYAGNKPFEILEKLRADIFPLLPGFQHKIDNEIYFQQYRQRYDVKVMVHVDLCVTSAKNLIKLYEHENLLLPYVAETCIKRLERQMDSNKCRIFISEHLESMKEKN